MFNNSKLIMFKSINPGNTLSMVIFDNDTLIVIDGNFGNDSIALNKYLESLHRPIDYWIITHTHCDHIGSITLALEEKKLDIRNIVENVPSRDITLKLSDQGEYYLNIVNKFYDGIESYKGNIIHPELKEYTFGTFKFTFFKNGIYGTTNDLNDYSMVFKVKIEDKTCLVTSDLTTEGSNILLKEYGDNLKSDFVTISHHGFGGASNEFYDRVSPSIALWPCMENGFNCEQATRIKNLLNEKIIPSFKTFEGDIVLE